jgi:hypothetical protein
LFSLMYGGVEFCALLALALALVRLVLLLATVVLAAGPARPVSRHPAVAR